MFISNIYHSAEELIGGTPLLAPERLMKAYSAMVLAKEPENAGKTIVVLLPDTGDRYLSTDLFGA